MYCGPSSSLAPDQFATLDHRWAYQPKLDGAFCTVTTDRRGTITNMLYRSGRTVGSTDADGLRGQYIGLPDAVLYGELEAQTEASVRARAARGFALLHVFDIGRVAGRSVERDAYSARYGLLHEWQAHVECYEPDAARAEWFRRDSAGLAHDVLGRFCRPQRGALRRLPIVPMHRGQDAGRSLWSSYVEREGGEGVVAVRLDAPMGRHGAKRKCRATTTLDCLVVSVGGKAAVLSYRGHSFVVSAACKAAADARPGDIVEVLANGWQESSVCPKHARIVRLRYDLRAQDAAGRP